MTIQTEKKTKAKTYIFLLVPEGFNGTTAQRIQVSPPEL